MLNSYLLSLADNLDKAGKYTQADVIDNIRMAQAVSMPETFGQSYDKAAAAAQEVQKLTTQQASMIKSVDADIKSLKEMHNTIARGARDFWRFRRSKYQGSPQVQQQPVTDMNAFGLRGVPAPQQTRRSQIEVAPRSTNAPANVPGTYAPAGRMAPAQSVAPYNDEVEEFFQWLEAEQARKMQQGGGMLGGGNMNLPFQIG
jgi:hypothetical protein